MPHHSSESPFGAEQESSHSSTIELLKKNLQWSEAIYQQNKRIQRRLTTIVVFGYVKWLLILAPIILAIIYLPPFFQDVADRYRPIINTLINKY